MALLALFLRRTGLHFLSLSPVVIRNTFLQPGHTRQPTSYPMHLNPEDGGSMFLRNMGIHLHDYMDGTTQKTTTRIMLMLPIWTTSKCSYNNIMNGQQRSIIIHCKKMLE
jgi:hypothetical protein